jgi:cell division topological specificity factor MinE
MSILSFLLGEKKKSASVAKERLQIILAHERSGHSAPADYLPALQRELVAVIFEVREDQRSGPARQPGAPGQPRSARGQDRNSAGLSGLRDKSADPQGINFPTFVRILQRSNRPVRRLRRAASPSFPAFRLLAPLGACCLHHFQVRSHCVAANQRNCTKCLLKHAGFGFMSNDPPFVKFSRRLQQTLFKWTRRDPAATTTRQKRSTMKKSLLTLALGSLFAGSAFAQTSVTLYGIADASVHYTTNADAANHSQWKWTTAPSRKAAGA